MNEAYEQSGQQMRVWVFKPNLALVNELLIGKYAKEQKSKRIAPELSAEYEDNESIRRLDVLGN